jgi:hypothetical protein
VSVVYRYATFDQLVNRLSEEFLVGALKVPTRHWQGVDVSERPEMVPYELEDVTVNIAMLGDQEAWFLEIRPNEPWAEHHFKERVAGIPFNPPPSHEYWPYAQAGNSEFRENPLGKFSHTYPERFFPKFAGDYVTNEGHKGIRFSYGDLHDVVKLIVRDPHTRQAYLPVFFPEDTGAHHGERIPCTLGYLFRYRRQTLDIVYYIRSCDFRRHFRDDVYLAGRLAQWMAERLREAELEVNLGDLVMHIGSFHVFEGDLPLMKNENRKRMNDVLGNAF